MFSLIALMITHSCVAGPRLCSHPQALIPLIGGSTTSSFLIGLYVERSISRLSTVPKMLSLLLVLSTASLHCVARFAPSSCPRRTKHVRQFPIWQKSLRFIAVLCCVKFLQRGWVMTLLRRRCVDGVNCESDAGRHNCLTL